mgnify:CR=1 FL=1
MSIRRLFVRLRFTALYVSTRGGLTLPAVTWALLRGFTFSHLALICLVGVVIESMLRVVAERRRWLW